MLLTNNVIIPGFGYPGGYGGGYGKFSHFPERKYTFQHAENMELTKLLNYRWIWRRRLWW